MALRPGTLLADRFLIGERLGGGAQAFTCGAVDRRNGRQVVVKELALSRLDEWKPYDLFAREARVLASLNHPRIPEFIEYFKQEEDDDLFLYLVTARAPGKSLAAWVQAGWRPTEGEVCSIARSVLGVLEYLHGLPQPVVHRDLKPSNLIREDNGRIYIVDFGAVQDVVRPQGGSTVVGTFGYMAPEQFAGRAVPASDLYGLSATLVHLLSGLPPSQMRQFGLKLDFRQRVACTEALAEWLECLLEPVLERRLGNATLARYHLEHLGSGELARRHYQGPGSGGRSAPAEGHKRVKMSFKATPACRPAATLAQVRREDGMLVIALSLPEAAVVETCTRVEIAPDHFTFLYEDPASRLNSMRWGDTSLITYVGVQPEEGITFQEQHWESHREFPFGAHLSRIEQEWLTAEIGNYLAGFQGSQPGAPGE